MHMSRPFNTHLHQTMPCMDCSAHTKGHTVHDDMLLRGSYGALYAALRNAGGWEWVPIISSTTNFDLVKRFLLSFLTRPPLTFPARAELRSL
jgi:hypothetical protein